MERPRLLWVRSHDGCETRVARAIADEFFTVIDATSARSAVQSVQRCSPHVLCWEFEDTQAAQLRAMRDFKASNPSLPVLMLTTQHSEALAVWAFRARVWNYLVKPVAASELRANFRTLAEMAVDAKGPARAVRFVGALLPDDVTAEEEPRRLLCVKAAVEQVERHHAEKLRQSTVAAKCGMSSCRFSRAFKAAYGMTFSEYLMRYRIARACHLLRRGSHNATSAGLAVGFEDPSHFARAFRKLLHTSPSSYQREKPPLRPLFERRRRMRTRKAARPPSMRVPPAIPLQVAPAEA
jgi:AraC-like DNA-binding protein/ActR/RegA family two-component response regulator